MTVEKRIEAFAKLGDFLSQFQPEGIVKNDNVLLNDTFLEPFTLQVNRAFEFNGWFTKDNVLTSFSKWGKTLTNSNLDKWVSQYNLNPATPLNIGVIMAGNIPLVGFHDILSVLITGNKALIKLSSNDKLLIPLLTNYLIHIEPTFKSKISFSDQRRFSC